jgi:hypothetical protein
MKSRRIFPAVVVAVAEEVVTLAVALFPSLMN